MAPSRTPWSIALIFSFVLLLLFLSVAGSALADKPVITTPTPTPENPYASVPGGIGGSLAGLPPAAVPAEVNVEEFSYTVQPGDNLLRLALTFSRDLDTMSCATRPGGADASTLIPGAAIIVPGLRDLCYTVIPGDTLPGIARRYGLSVEAITSIPWNGFGAPPYTVQPRQRILLPGVRRAPAARQDASMVSVPDDQWAHSPWPGWPYGDGHFIWPLAGPISQPSHAGHRALDIVADSGTPVRASDRGTVVLSGWSTIGYGFRVVIDHGNDYLTLYAHLSDIYVQPGQVVAKGQIIGLSGANGNVTGPHLHFEIRDFGVLSDPLSLLPNQ